MTYVIIGLIMVLTSIYLMNNGHSYIGLIIAFIGILISNYGHKKHKNNSMFN